MGSVMHPVHGCVFSGLAHPSIENDALFEAAALILIPVQNQYGRRLAFKIRYRTRFFRQIKMFLYRHAQKLIQMFGGCGMIINHSRKISRTVIVHYCANPQATLPIFRHHSHQKRRMRARGTAPGCQLIGIPAKLLRMLPQKLKRQPAVVRLSWEMKSRSRPVFHACHDKTAPRHFHQLRNARNHALLNRG